MMRNDSVKKELLKDKIKINRSILKMIQSPLNLTMVCLLLVNDKDSTLKI